VPATSSPVTDSETGRPRLSCLCSTLDGAVCVALEGELDITTVPEADWVLTRAHQTAASVVLDLRALELVDAGGADFLVAVARRVRGSGGRLVVVRGSVEVDWFFALIGLDRQLELVDRLPDAA
jgi:anti-anti-sigma factor